MTDVNGTTMLNLATLLNLAEENTTVTDPIERRLCPGGNMQVWVAAPLLICVHASVGGWLLHRHRCPGRIGGATAAAILGHTEYCNT